MKRDPDAGRHGGRRKGTTEDEMVGITDSVDMSLSKFWETLKNREAQHAAIHGVSKSRT